MYKRNTKHLTLARRSNCEEGTHDLLLKTFNVSCYSNYKNLYLCSLN